MLGTSVLFVLKEADHLAFVKEAERLLVYTTMP